MKQLDEFFDIPGYEGYYGISQDGRVKSYSRFNSRTERILKPCINNAGYLKYVLSKDGVIKNHNLHALLAITFLDKNYTKKGLVVDHIDRDKRNNNLDNLRITTVRQNSNNISTKNKSSKYPGVTYHKRGKAYQANIWADGKLKYLGWYKTEIEAYNARKTAENELDG